MNCRTIYAQMLSSVRDSGVEYIDQDGRHCKELANTYFSVEDSSDAQELVKELQRVQLWVYPSTEELRSIMLPTSVQGAHMYSYAPRLFETPSQIEDFVIPLLKANPKSRRAIAILYQPSVDSKANSQSVPTLLSVHFRVDEKLDLTCHLRSTDVLVGLPANLYQIRVLQEYVAEKLGLKPGKLHLLCSSAHYFTEYDEIYDVVAKGIKKERRSA
jgi:thymidylate synthase